MCKCFPYFGLSQKIYNLEILANLAFSQKPHTSFCHNFVILFDDNFKTFDNLNDFPEKILSAVQKMFFI